MASLTNPSPDATRSTKKLLPPHEFFLRPAHLSDLPTMALHNTKAFWNNPVQHHFLCPRASEHPEDLTRIFLQQIRRRLLSPNNKTLVCCLTSNPTTLVGFAQFSRLGTDGGATMLHNSISWWDLIWTYRILAFLFRVLDAVNNFIWKDRITDFANVKKAETWFAKDEERYWDPQKFPQRVNRWRANSVVVAPEWQGRGVGKLLMAEVLRWAQEEKVVVGLTSSPHGEYMYRKVGFEMLGGFVVKIGEDEGGGIMIWYPEGWGGEESSVKKLN